MPTPQEFLEATKWAAGGTLVLAAITVLAFVLGWGIRFRLVGATSFAAVLTGGLLGLSFEPFTRTVVPGAANYATVYDSGSSQVVIAVPTTIEPDRLEATLQQAASNLFKPYRLGLPGETATIRARTIVHQPGGVSELLYLGQVQPAAADADAKYDVTLYPDQIAQLPAADDA